MNFSGHTSDSSNQSSEQQKQALRMRRMQMALATYITLFVLGIFAYMKNMVPGIALVLMCAVVSVAHAGYYLAFKTGFNLRLRDPSMTIPQLLVGNLVGLILVHYATQARGVFMMVYLMGYSFGIFRLSTRQLLALAALSTALFGLDTWWTIHYHPGVLDPDRMIFYGGTAAGTDAKDQGIQFFAYDLKAKKVIYSGPDGPARYMILAKSTGRVYWTPGKEDGVGQLVRYDPAKEGGPVKIDAEIGVRAATQETKDGKVFTVSKGGKAGEATLFAFDTKTEKTEELGSAAVGVNNYITSLDVDPTGRYVYYIPGAHGGSEKDNSAVVQFDTKTKTRKVIACLHPYFREKTGATLVGTFSSAVDPKGDKLYVTWNVNRGGKAWDCCALTVIHIPESER